MNSVVSRREPALKRNLSTFKKHLFLVKLHSVFEVLSWCLVIIDFERSKRGFEPLTFWKVKSVVFLNKGCLLKYDIDRSHRYVWEGFISTQLIIELRDPSRADTIYEIFSLRLELSTFPNMTISLWIQTVSVPCAPVASEAGSNWRT